MKSFSVGNYKRGTIVHCTTQEQWDELTKITGYTWQKNWWPIHKDMTGMNITDRAYGEIDWYKKHAGEFTIISYEEFIQSLSEINNGYEIF